MKTYLRIAVLFFLLSAGGENFVSAQMTPCTTAVSGLNKICSGGCATLTAQLSTMSICGNVTYQWSSGQTTSSIIVCPTATTTYLVMGCCTSPNSCCDSASFTVLVAPTPTVTVQGADTICAGDAVTLCAGSSMSNGASYLWMPGGQTTTCIIDTPTTTTTYTVTVTDMMSGCSGDTTFTVNVISCPTTPCSASISGSTQICGAGCTTLNAGFSTTLSCTGLTYQWFPGGQTTDTIVVCPTAATSYSVIICCNGSSPCCDTASITVNVSAPPVVIISGADTVCLGQGTSLCTNSIPGASFVWMPGGQTTPCIYAAPTITTTYTVTVTDANGCTGDSTFTLNVVNCPGPGCTAYISGQMITCSGGCDTLNASISSNLNCISVSYQWMPGGQTTSYIIVCPTSTSTYIAMVCCNTAMGSCCDTASFTVNVNPAPQVNITGPTSICVGQTATLCTNTGVSWQWMPGFMTTMCVNVSPTVTTTYTVVVTDLNGCSTTAMHTLTVLQCPTGVDETIFINEINIFPNPFSEYATVKITDTRLIPSELRIYNLLGMEVKSLKIESYETKIFRDNLPSGIYYYRLTQKQRTIGNGKIVIE